MNGALFINNIRLFDVIFGLKDVNEGEEDACIRVGYTVSSAFSCE